MIDTMSWHKFDKNNYRLLNSEEKNRLVQNRNSAQNWNTIHVQDGFEADRVHECRFEGEVHIGEFRKEYLEHRSLRLRTGLYRSTIVDSVIGSNSSLHNLLFCRNQYIGNDVIVLNAGEISSKADASFGTGIVEKEDGTLEKSSIEIINENGGRAVLAFPGMTCTDAYLWAKFRDDKVLMKRLEDLTLSSSKAIRPPRGVIGAGSVVINVKCIRDSLIGPASVVDGAEALINSTVLSDGTERSEIGTAVQIRDSIIGFGSRISSAAQLSSVVTGTAVSVSQSARICHTYIGDNAAIACCEIANCLLLPSHAQHHNNSFLIASMIGGQSNIAAGATIGSNHNSRVNDGELWASRGFWPGLCTNFKHNSRFASFTICAKGDYSSELDVKLPFSLLIPDQKSGGLLLFPAFWFTHNMYAVMRSASKFRKRDTRIHKLQYIEHDLLAPDTVEEIFAAIDLLELWVGKALLSSREESVTGRDNQELIQTGRDLLFQKPSRCSSLRIMAERIEKGRYETPLKNCAQAWKMYRTMIRYYGARNLISHFQKNGFDPVLDMLDSDIGNEEKVWINLGSMVVGETALFELLERMKNEAYIGTWADVHKEFDQYVTGYRQRKVRHAISSLARLENIPSKEMTAKKLKGILERSIEDFKTVAKLTRTSREKDFSDPYRSMVYRSTQEMETVVGTAESDSVVKGTEEEMDTLISLTESLMEKLSR